MTDLIWILFDLSSGYLLVETFNSRFDCLEARAQYVQLVQAFLHCTTARWS